MLLSMQSIGNTISAHPWLTILLFLLTSTLVLHYFSDVSKSALVAGVVRLLGSIFVAPFHFIRSAVTSVAGFTANDGADARSRTYLLHRSIEYTRLAALVSALLIVATGMTVAVLGVWPSKQFEQRKVLRAQRTAADSLYLADSLRLIELSGTGQEEIARRREALRDSLRQRRTTIAASVTRFWQSVDNTVQTPDNWNYTLDSAVAELVRRPGADSAALAPGEFSGNVATPLMDRLINSEADEEVWDDDPSTYRYSEDSALVANTASVKQALGTLVKGDTAWRPVQRGFLLALSALETQQALVNTLRVGSAEQEIETLRSRTTITAAERERINQALDDIAWFAGIKFFLVTLLYTFLLFVVFVWAVGLAIETTLLFVGIAQDVAAVRRQGE